MLRLYFSGILSRGHLQGISDRVALKFSAGPCQNFGAGSKLKASGCCASFGGSGLNMLEWPALWVHLQLGVSAVRRVPAVQSEAASVSSSQDPSHPGKGRPQSLVKATTCNSMKDPPSLLVVWLSRPSMLPDMCGSRMSR